MNSFPPQEPWQFCCFVASVAWQVVGRKGLALLLLLVACGGLPAEPVCPSSPSHEAPCCASEVGDQLCIAGQRWVCEPNSWPCYDSEAVNGECPNAPDGGELHPELVDRRAWYENGSCE